MTICTHWVQRCLFRATRFDLVIPGEVALPADFHDHRDLRRVPLRFYRC